MLIAHSSYPLLEVLATVAFFFVWVAWFWTLVIVLSDVFARSDLSGPSKAGWTLLLIVVPFAGVLGYLVAHGAEMGERRTARSPASRRPAAERGTVDRSPAAV